MSYDDYCNGCGSYDRSCTHDDEHARVPRDLHDLYKEAAEAWASDKLGRLSCFECCKQTHFYEGDELVRTEPHAADCKAARILDLKREGA